MSDTPMTESAFATASKMMTFASQRSYLLTIMATLEDDLSDAHNQITVMNQVIGDLTDEREALKQQLADANAALVALNHAGNSVSFGGAA